VGELGAEGGQDTAVGRAAAEGGGSSQPPQEHGARRDGMQIDFWGVFCAAPFSRLFQLIFLSRNNIFLLQKSANIVFQPAYQHSRMTPLFGS
jgi:hypothetical protein